MVSRRQQALAMQGWTEQTWGLAVGEGCEPLPATGALGEKLEMVFGVWRLLMGAWSRVSTVSWAQDGEVDREIWGNVGI